MNLRPRSTIDGTNCDEGSSQLGSLSAGSMNLRAPLAVYGVNDAKISRLRGGFINRVYRIEVPGGEGLVLKRYSASDLLAERLRYLCRVQTQLRETGLPI